MPLTHMGQQLSRFLAEDNMNQSALASRLGVSRQAVSYYVQTPRWHSLTVSKIAKAINRPVKYFFPKSEWDNA